jgi:hypothetical protein
MQQLWADQSNLPKKEHIIPSEVVNIPGSL